MPSSFPQVNITLDRLDAELLGLSREHGQVLNLDAFRRHIQRDSIQHPAQPAHTGATDAERRLRHELNLAFTDLGGAVFALAHFGALTDERLAARVRRIHELHAELDSLPAVPTTAHPEGPGQVADLRSP